MIRADDAARLDVEDGDLLCIGNRLGEVMLHARIFDGMQQGVVVAESIWPNRAFVGGLGINTLVSSEPGPPNGGATYHDTAVWIKRQTG